MQINTEDILTRLKSALNVKNDAELSKVINITPSGISTWKARNSIDHNKVIEVCAQHGIDLNYIFGSNVGGLSTVAEEKSSHYANSKSSPPPSMSHTKPNHDLLVQTLLRNIQLLEDRLVISEATIKKALAAEQRAETAEKRFNDAQAELVKAQADIIEYQKKLKSALDALSTIKKKKAA